MVIGVSESRAAYQQGDQGALAEPLRFLQEGTIPERKALIRDSVENIGIVGNEATLTCTNPVPKDGVTSESTPVHDFVQPCPFR